MGDSPDGTLHMVITRRVKMSQADDLVFYGDALQLFHDQHNEAFAFLDGEAIPLRSKRIKQYLAKRMWERL